MVDMFHYLLPLVWCAYDIEVTTIMYVCVIGVSYLLILPQYNLFSMGHVMMNVIVNTINYLTYYSVHIIYQCIPNSI